jgi:hypothetical protein
MPQNPKIQIAQLDEVPENLHGYQFKPVERQKLSQGDKVFVENMRLPDSSIRDGHLWLTKNPEGQIEVRYMFKAHELKIDDKILDHKLTKEEKEELEKGKVVGPLRLKSDFNAFIQVDNKLNRVVIKSHQELSVPEKIGGYVLNANDQNRLANGEMMFPRVFKGDKGYFIANFKLTDDRKGHEYSNIKDLKNLSQKEINKLIGELNKDKDVTVSNIISVSEKIFANGQTKQEEKINTNIGVLLDHGSAPFENDSNNKPSYFVKIQAANGERVVWGVDLERAIDDANVQKGDKIGLENLGKQMVTVTGPKRDEKGNIMKDDKGNIIETSFNTHRNTWKIEKIENISISAGKHEALDKAISVRDFKEISRLSDVHTFAPDTVDGLINKYKLTTEESIALKHLTKTEKNPSEMFRNALSEKRYNDLEKIIDSGYKPTPAEKISFTKDVTLLSKEQRITLNVDRLSSKILETDTKAVSSKEKQHKKGMGINS